MTTSSLQPTSSKERILALDFLRGFAILGILIMNIQSFSMPGPAYLNPAAYGDLTGLNKWVWIISHILADMKFMTLFSVLFGAGIILVVERAMKRTGKSAGLHYRRNFWLLIIGLTHAHLIWYGDILVPYALCAFFVYLFRNKSPKVLIIIGLVFIAIQSVFFIFMGISIPFMPEESAIQAKTNWIHSAAEIEAEIAAITGSLAEQIRANSRQALMMETVIFILVFFWRVSGLMLIGMALYKSGVLTAKRSKDFYRKGLLIGWGIGFPLIIFGIFKNFQAEWSFEYSMYLGSQYNYWGSLGVSFGYICGIMLIAKSDALSWLKRRLAAVGQMALTNYISQSLICVFIFWGIGFGLFGQIDRTSQVLVVLSVWVLQILWSKPWLDKFRFGPLEWLWRSLTYLKIQPMKK